MAKVGAERGVDTSAKAGTFSQPHHLLEPVSSLMDAFRSPKREEEERWDPITPADGEVRKDMHVRAGVITLGLMFRISDFNCSPFTEMKWYGISVCL
jgi:hypothetical protein